MRTVRGVGYRFVRHADVKHPPRVDAVASTCTGLSAWHRSTSPITILDRVTLVEQLRAAGCVFLPRTGRPARGQAEEWMRIGSSRWCSAGSRVNRSR